MTAPAEPTPVILVAGPTASGKSALALHLAETFHGVVINADSMQVYRDLPILTAQPGQSARARAPHRLYGEVDAAEAFSAGGWRQRAIAEIARSQGGGRVPILVGGTGLYFKILLEGIADIPLILKEIRNEVRALHEKLGPTAFHAALARLDPEGAARLAPGDTQRVLRAYEVVLATGRPLGDWQAAQPREAGLAATAILLLPPRAPLYAISDARFLGMWDSGAEAEVRALLGRRLDPALPAMRALGVREIAGWLRGEITREAAIAAAQQATRNYAKRQYTWFKHQMTARPGLRIRILDEPFSEACLPDMVRFIRRPD
jgi:tRNA dimethylallyltransferase